MRPRTLTLALGLVALMALALAPLHSEQPSLAAWGAYGVWAVLFLVALGRSQTSWAARPSGRSRGPRRARAPPAGKATLKRTANARRAAKAASPRPRRRTR